MTPDRTGETHLSTAGAAQSAPTPRAAAVGRAGLRPRDATDVADIVAQASATKCPLRIAGGESWLDAGRPVPPAPVLHLAGLTGIVEYNPGDLTLTAQAGTPLAEIAALTAQHNQWSALDAPGWASGTIGATIATASAGPLAASIGLPRDVVLGLEFVSGEGERIRGGGRVVKNVAGFDIVRLQTGAWGTLGVITEVTVRLRGRPEVDRTLALATPRSAADVVRHLRQCPEPSLAAEYLNAPLSATLGLGDTPCLLVRLGGNADAVDAHTRYLSALGEWSTPPAHVWNDLADVEPAGALVVRVSAALASTADTVDRVLQVTLGSRAMVHATVARGIVRVILPPDSDSVTRLFALRALGRCVVERAPAEVWPQFPAAADDRLSKRLRRALDPESVLNPGLMGGADG